MVATVRSVSSAGNAARYFYFIENNFECSRGWCNTLAQDNLGLDELERRVFEEILNGQITERNENNETIITQLGRKTEQGVIHHPGQELILSAPKSVSIMGLVAEDDRVLEAHEKAVDEIVRYLERTMVYTRVQKHGEMQLEQINFNLTNTVEQTIDVGQLELAVRGQRDPADLEALLRRELLPRDDVGVVLELAQQDRVARTEVRRTP